MTLDEIERIFEKYADLNKFKIVAMSNLKNYISDKNIIEEFKEYLPKNKTFQDLDIIYRDTIILLSGRYRSGPIYRIRYVLTYKGCDIFWYDLEFVEYGEVVDDYFNVF